MLGAPGSIDQGHLSHPGFCSHKTQLLSVYQNLPAFVPSTSPSTRQTSLISFNGCCLPWPRRTPCKPSVKAPAISPFTSQEGKGPRCTGELHSPMLSKQPRDCSVCGMHECMDGTWRLGGMPFQSVKLIFSPQKRDAPLRRGKDPAQPCSRDPGETQTSQQLDAPSHAGKTHVFREDCSDAASDCTEACRHLQK